MTTNKNYSQPVARLLTITNIPHQHRYERWRNYVTDFGLTDEHVPELIELATNLDEVWSIGVYDETTTEGYAPLHAIRALGQLENPAAITPLLTLLGMNFAVWDSDYLAEHIPQALGLIGEPAFANIADFIADEGNDVWARIYCHSALEAAVRHRPELRDQALTIAAEQLQKYKHQDKNINASLVSAIVSFDGVEYASLIEEAYANERVDHMVQGDLEDVQIALGLLKKRLTPRHDWSAESPSQQMGKKSGTNNKKKNSLRKGKRSKKKRRKR